MLTCMARAKTDHHKSVEKLDSNASKTLSTQIKGMASRATGAYRNCAPCSDDKFAWSFRRTASWRSGSLSERLKGISSGEVTSASASLRRVDSVVFVEEGEAKEWVAQVEPGVLITFVSSLRGSNELKRIRFSREMFDKSQAQRWWTENSERVMELYNVKRLNRQAPPLPTTPKSEGKRSLKTESVDQESPLTPLLDTEQPSHALSQPTGIGTAYPSSNSSVQSQSNDDSYGVTSTPKISSISGAKTENSSMDVSLRPSLSGDADRSGDVPTGNGSELETEWVEQDEPGVYLTIREQPDGRRELRRVRFSREKYGEMHARLWWEENRARIHKQYL